MAGTLGAGATPGPYQGSGVPRAPRRPYRRAMGTPDLPRAAERIARLTASATDVVTLWRAASDVLSGAVPHFGAPCWYTTDPASLLITSHYNPEMAVFPAEWLADEYYGDDVNKVADVARSPSGLSTLHDALGGDPTSSPRWRQNREMGADQELVLALRTRTGEVWGALGLYREPDRPRFDPAERAFLTAVAPHLAEGARRALLVGEATDPDSPEAPGLLVLGAGWEVESASPEVWRWLAGLPDGDAGTGRLPSAVLSVAGAALRSAERPDRAGTVAVARVLARDGTWVVLHGATLLTTGEPRVAVIVEPAHPARIRPLLMSAYGLTERERDVTRLVLLGASTAQIAAELVVSPHTVQQHLKSVFDKTGVRSRRDLVGRIFFAHYEPRLRDNEDRAVRARPLRGGPLPGTSPSRPGAG